MTCFTRATVSRRLSSGFNRLAALPISALCGSIFACSEPAPQDAASSNARAREILEQVQIVAGGAETLANIRTIAVQYVHTRLGIPSSNDDSGPSMQSIDVIQVRDFENGRQFYERRAAGENGDWERVVIVPGSAFAINLHTGDVSVFAPDANSAALYSGLEFRWYVYAALNDAQFAASSLRLEADSTVGEQTFHVLSFQGPGTETNRLWIDVESNLIMQRSVSVSDPVTGVSTTTLEYLDYTMVGDVPIPMAVHLNVNGEPFERFDLQDVRLNAEIQESAFKPPR